MRSSLMIKCSELNHVKKKLWSQIKREDRTGLVTRFLCVLQGPDMDGKGRMWSE